MIKFVTLVAKNLGRNKVRTLLTGLAVITLVGIYSVVTSVTSKVKELVETQASQTKLVVSDRWVMPSRVPIRYVPEITAIDGVVDWTSWNIYSGFYDDSFRSERRGMGIATRPENLTEMHPELAEIDPAALEALEDQKSAALVGSGILDVMEWKVGDEFTFFSTSNPGKNLRFRIVGALPPGQWSRNFFFRKDYYAEGTGDDSIVNALWLRVSDPDAAQQVASRIQRDFDKREPGIKVETESAGVARMVGRNQAVLSIIDLVVTILLIDMVIVLSNSISITTRERRLEMAVLKVLGFQPSHIMALVIGEAVFVGALSGVIGTGGAWLFSDLTVQGVLPVTDVNRFMLNFPIPPIAVVWGLVIGILIGFSGSVLPAWDARKVRVTDVLAKVA